MTFKIRSVGEHFSLDSLAVAKITNYPFEKRDYKPFAQARLCLSDRKRLIVRMWAFEVSPKADVTQPCEDMMKEDSFLCFQLSMKKNYLSVCANAAGVLYAELVHADGTHTPLDSSLFSQSPFTGEDLQGEYWGMQFSVDVNYVNEWLDGDLCKEPLHGNLYKACFDPKHRHIGALFELHRATIYDPEAFGDFEITDY